MNSTKKLILAVGLFLQLSTCLYADSWSDAFEVFGGAQAVYDGNGSMPWSAAQAKTKGGSPELLAVGMFMSSGKPSDNAKKFSGAASQDDLARALDKARFATKAVVAPTAPAASGWGWSGAAAKPAAPVISVADMQKAVSDAQKADVSAATANNQALAAIVNSGKTGTSLYFAYIDVLFNLFQQAVSAIADSGTQQEVLQYIQSKAVKMSASAKGNKYNSRIIGRSSSKKETSKRNKRNR